MKTIIKSDIVCTITESPFWSPTLFNALTISDLMIVFIVTFPLVTLCEIKLLYRLEVVELFL